MTILATDSGVGSNEAPLGAPWVEAGTGNTMRRISNQFAATTGSTDCVYYHSGAVWPAEQRSSILAAVLVDAGNFDAGPCVRIVAGGGGDYYIFNLNSFIFTIYKVVNLGFTSLATVVTAGILANDKLSLKATTVGADVVLAGDVNDVQVLTFTDTSSPILSGNVGMGIFGGTERMAGFTGEGFGVDPQMTVTLKRLGSIGRPRPFAPGLGR